MDILSYLTELIKTRKEVGIVGLGTIYKKKSPGRYDAETHSFLPPSYRLDFTSELKETNALAEFVSKTKNLSYDSSAYFVEQFAEELQNQLREHAEADLGTLGKLTEDEGILSFTPASGIDFGFDFYGLPKLKDELKVEEQIETHLEADIITEEEVKEKEEIEVEDSVNEESTTGNSINDEEEIQEVAPTDDETTEQVETPVAADIETEQEVPEDEVPEDEAAENEEEETISEPTETTIPQEADEQPVYEEISEAHFQPEVKPQVFIETVENLIEEEDEEEQVPEPEIVSETPVQTAHQAVFIDEKPVTVQHTPDPTWTFEKRTDSRESHLDDELSSEENPKTPAYLKFIIAGAAVLALAAAIYFLKPEFFKGPTVKRDHPTARVNSTKRPDTSALNDSTIKSPQSLPPAPDHSKQDTSIAIADTGVPVDSVTTWEVIGSSVLNQKEADIAIAQFKAAGIDARAIPSSSKKRRIKISIATFDDEMSARDGRKKLVIKLKDPELYIFQNKHTHK